MSPLASDEYTECWNERFLERLGLLDDERLASFKEFWPFKPAGGDKISPRGTAHWDGRARVPLIVREGAVTIEAKAHRSEVVKLNDSSKAGEEALKKISEHHDRGHPLAAGAAASTDSCSAESAIADGGRCVAGELVGDYLNEERSP